MDFWKIHVNHFPRIVRKETMSTTLQGTITSEQELRARLGEGRKRTAEQNNLEIKSKLGD